MKGKDIDDSIPSTMREAETATVDEDENRSREGSVDMPARNPGKDVSEV
jgi:hypothetical protein